MVKSFKLQQAVRYAIVAVATASSSRAFAQTAPATAATPPAPITLEEVIITGSRLKTPNEVSISSITSVTAEDIQSTGLTRAEDVLNNLPMVFAAQGATVSNGSDGTATVNLRNLGPQRTLVLVNGRRLGPGTPDGRNFSDINQIPASLIERVDVLTGGASAVYGADAVAGVVNFVLNTKFEGVRIDGNVNMYQHNNSNAYARSIVNAAGDPLPPGSVNTGFGKDLSIVIGSNFADGKGNATFYGTYTQSAAVLQSKYDYSACTINSPSKAGLAAGRGAKCGGSGTSAGGYFQAYNAAGSAALFTNKVDRTTGVFRHFTSGDLFNFGPLNYYQRPSERYTAGTFLNYDINPHANAYAEFMFSRNTSVAQIAPSGDFFLTSTIPCAAPLLTAQEKSIICSPANIAAQTPAGGPAPTGITMYIGRRNIEGGGRQSTFASSSYHTTIGLKGDFGPTWNYDVYFQTSTVQIANGNLNFLSNTKIQNALNVVTDPTTGQPVCQSVLNRTDKGCVPWNIWVPGAVTAAATNYLAIPLILTGDVTEQVASGSVTGDLGQYGVRVPSASSGLQVNFGAEWREDKVAFNPDDASQQGIAAGSGGPIKPVSGGFRVSELFTEMRLPLVDSAPMAKDLAVEGGYRYSDYSLGFKTSTFKLGLEWEPTQDLRARTSFNHAVRAPNIAELFTPQAVLLDGTVDPCAGAIPQFSPTLCANSGVTAAQYGNIGANPAAQYNGFLGGNPNLKPESADTYSIGLVLEPHVISNFSLSVDYFDIKIKDVIGAIGGNTILTNCITTGDPVYCAAVHRNANGSLWKSPDGFVSDLNVNFGSNSTKGIDLKGSYRVSLKSVGSLSFHLEGTKLQKLIFQPLTNGPSYDCKGLYGAACGVPSPSWRHTFETKWSTPWHGLDLGARWRYFGSVASEHTSTNPQIGGSFFPTTAFIKAYNWFDLTASMAFSNGFSIRVGANNIFDKDPPISVSGALSDCAPAVCNGNTYAQVYDTLGRYLYAHVTLKF